MSYKTSNLSCDCPDTAVFSSNTLQFAHGRRWLGCGPVVGCARFYSLDDNDVISANLVSLSLLLCACAGEVHSALGDYKQAEQFYLMSLSAKPSHLPAVIGYSNLLEREVMQGVDAWKCATFI